MGEGCTFPLPSGRRCNLPRRALIHDSAQQGGHGFLRGLPPLAERDYDEVDQLIDTDPIALGVRCRVAEARLAACEKDYSWLVEEMRAQERAEQEDQAAVLRFLRDLSESGPSVDARKALSDAADAIEKGEHRT